MSSNYLESKIKLVGYTRPTFEIVCKNMNTQDLISFCARVSNPDNQENMETSEKLVKYLIDNKHWSPFEMVNVLAEIETTRDISRQILRHRSFSFQEFSQRYSNPLDNLSFVFREARLQDKKNRQNSIEFDDTNGIKDEWEEWQRKVIDISTKAYMWASDNGIAKEQCRVVLPEGLTKTKLYMNGTLRSWIHYCELRMKEGTQKEHMDVAYMCAKVVEEIFPVTKIILGERHG